MDRYVHKSLKPRSIDETKAIPGGVPAITHYVPGQTKVLLMEPLEVSGNDQKLRERTGNVFQKLSAYSRGWSREGRTACALAYVLPTSGQRDAVERITRELSEVAKVFHTGEDDARAGLLGWIREVGDSAPTLPSL